MNEEFPFLPKTRELLAWQLSGNKFKERNGMISGGWRSVTRRVPGAVIRTAFLGWGMRRFLSD